MSPITTELFDSTCWVSDSSFKLDIVLSDQTGTVSATFWSTEFAVLGLTVAQLQSLWEQCSEESGRTALLTALNAIAERPHVWTLRGRHFREALTWTVRAVEAVQS